MFHLLDLFVKRFEFCTLSNFISHQTFQFLANVLLYRASVWFVSVCLQILSEFVEQLLYTDFFVLLTVVVVEYNVTLLALAATPDLNHRPLHECTVRSIYVLSSACLRL